MKVMTKLMPGPWNPANRWLEFQFKDREGAVEFAEAFPHANRILILVASRPSDVQVRHEEQL
jgi:hypothetical protein